MKKQSVEFITEACGWYGIVAILVAYAFLSLGILESNQLSYQVLNLTGGMGIVVDAVADKNAQPAVLNIIWSAFALIAIVRILI